MRLSDNAFYLLGASPYEQKYRIIDKCEDKLFEEDDNGIDYEAQQNILLSPVKRLSEEIRWFFSEDLDVFESVREKIYLFENKAFEMESPIASINMLVYAMMEGHLSRSLSEIVLLIDKLYEQINCDEILAEINEVREVVGISDIKDVEQIQKEVERLKDDIREAFQVIAKEVYALDYAEEALQVAEKTYACGQYTDVATEFLGMYYLDISSEINKLYTSIQERFAIKESLRSQLLVTLIKDEFGRLCKLERPLFEYGSLHHVTLVSKEVFWELRNFFFDSIAHEGIDTIVEVIQGLKTICSFNDEFVKDLNQDLEKINEVNNTNLFYEHFNELGNLSDRMQKEVVHEEDAGRRNLRFYNNVFVKNVEHYTRKIFGDIQLTREQEIDAARFVTRLYIYMAWGLVFAYEFRLAYECVQKAHTYAYKSGDSEIIRLTNEQYSVIKEYYDKYGGSLSSRSSSSSIRSSSSSISSSSSSSSGYSSSSSSTPSSSSDDSSGGGCLVTLFILTIGAFILVIGTAAGGPIGFFIAIAIIAKLFK